VSFDRIKSRLRFAVTRRVPDGVAEVARAVRAGVFDSQPVATLQNAGA